MMPRQLQQRRKMPSKFASQISCPRLKLNSANTLVNGSSVTRFIHVTSLLALSTPNGLEEKEFMINPDSMNGLPNAQNSKLMDKDLPKLTLNISCQEKIQCYESYYIYRNFN